MKRLVCILLAVLLLLPGGSVSGAEEVYEIYTVEDLQEFAERIKTEYDLDARLMADLDLEGLEWKPMGGPWTYVEDQRYRGDFDGNDHVIRNMTIRYVQSTDLGFFGTLGIGSCIHDLTMEQIDIDVDPQKYGNYITAATSTVGGIAAETAGTIKRCRVTGKIYGVNVVEGGGIIGNMDFEAGTGIFDCVTDVDQTYEITEAGHSRAGHAEVGGIAGMNTGIIDNCHAFGMITLTGYLNSCGHMVGGVVGMSGYGDALVRNSSNHGSIQAEVVVAAGEDPSEPKYGGVAAGYYGDASMVNCFNTGSITASAADVKIFAGGIAGDYQPGYDYWIRHDNCWSSGSIQVSDADGMNQGTAFREDADVCAYYVGDGSQIGAYRGQLVPESWLKNGMLTQKLNENRIACGDNGLLRWQQTEDGPRLIDVRVSANPFTDVPFDAFYLDSVIWAVENGVTTGTSETCFSPGMTCQRAAAVTFLWRAEGCPEPMTMDNPFVDVKPTAYYYKAVLWAVERGITNGTSQNTFSPLGICNRSQVVTFLYRAKGEPQAADTSNPFGDVEPGKWYTAPILWAVDQGITNGMGDGSFGIDVSCNRAQIVTFLYRAYN